MFAVSARAQEVTERYGLMLLFGRNSASQMFEFPVVHMSATGLEEDLSEKHQDHKKRLDQRNTLGPRRGACHRAQQHNVRSDNRCAVREIHRELYQQPLPPTVKALARLRRN